MGNNLSVCIDMGAKNNGVFIVKTDGDAIVDKKAFTVVIDETKINFSKKSRRENRHRVRNYKRRKLAKRLLWRFLDKYDFEKSQIETINGILNNRGYTFLSTSSEFEAIDDITVEFLEQCLPELKGLQSKEDFEERLSIFEALEELKKFIDEIVGKIDTQIQKKKAEFEEEFRDDAATIKKDLKSIKELFLGILNEIETGSKPRKKYLQEIKNEIESLEFIVDKKIDKKSFYNLIGNISNLQLRILRKFFDGAKRKKDEYRLLKDYFNFFHWNYNETEKEQRSKLFDELEKYENLEDFLKNCDPSLTVPPYEDMNNRGTYKCNSLLINPSKITPAMQESIDILWDSPKFEVLHGDDLTYAQKLQRLFDISYQMIDKSIHPREVFKKDKGDIGFYEKLLKDNFKEFSDFAKGYYDFEQKAINGIVQNDLLIRCNKNTPAKNNFKHILLKPLFEYDFSLDDIEKLEEKIRQTHGLKTHLQKISDVAKSYQNGFYHHIEACFENQQCQNDEAIKDIVKNLPNDLKAFQDIFKELGFESYILKIEHLDSENLKRVLNSFKQTYEILFKDINGFSKTCKTCTVENNRRSSSDEPIAKRLLSDVAKPIDGMLDMMLDRLAWEVVSQIDSIENVNTLEIILEQNRFEFEEGLASIKGKRLKKKEHKDLLNINVCPYTGNKFDKGEYDHILPQSKELFNSKANLIYCSSEGNRNIKKDRRFYLEDLHIKHLKEIFKTENIEEIRSFIKQNLESVDKDRFTNFDNLKLKEQIALRYALFLDEKSSEFQKAKEILKGDRLKTVTNGTQKRLARLIYEKIKQKFDKNIECNVQVIDNLLISAARKDLSYDKTTGEINELWKEKIQNSHSHCIDAMVAFYLANATIKGRYHQKRTNLASIEPRFEFGDIYLKNSNIVNVNKKQTFINAKDIGAYKLFQDTIYSENYKHIDKNFQGIDTLIKYSLLYQNKNNKKHFIKKREDLEENTIYKIDVHKTSNLLFELFHDNNKQALRELKFLDKLRFNTTRADIVQIFFDDKKTKLLEFSQIGNIPPNSVKTFKAIHKILKNSDIFDEADGKKSLNLGRLYRLLEKTFRLQQRKRGKKRHLFSLSILGQNAKYRVKRGKTYQVLGGENIATKNYIINETIKPVPYFSKNVIPLKIEDMLQVLDLDNDAKQVYEVAIETEKIATYVKSLTYIVAEASRCIVSVKLRKKSFKGVNFDSIKTLDGSKDCHFRKLLHYLDDRNSLCLTCIMAQANEHNDAVSDSDRQLLKQFLGGIRDGLKGKAI